MHDLSKEGFIARTVLIEFEDGPISFRLRLAATLGDISKNSINASCTWKWQKHASALARHHAGTNPPRDLSPANCLTASFHGDPNVLCSNRRRSPLAGR